MNYTLFGHPESGHSYKVKLALEVAGMAHHYHVVDIGLPHQSRPEPFRSLATYGEVPVLLYQGRGYVQSNAILLFLAEQSGQFGGESPSRLAHAREWLFWEANRLGMSLPHLRFARRFDAQAYPNGALLWFERRYAADIERLERELSDGRRFILDDQPSVADFSLCGYLFWADQAGVSVPPGVTAWLERISQLPGWVAPYTLLTAPTTA
jgi:glutathione S-transferase